MKVQMELRIKVLDKVEIDRKTRKYEVAFLN